MRARNTRLSGRLWSRALYAALAVVLLCLLAFFRSGNDSSYSLYSYTSLFKEEERTARKFIEAEKDPKFVLFRQFESGGFYNQTQEILLHHHLALESSRIYVYQPLVLRPRKEPQPLSAFLLGPTQGSAPASLFNEICSKQDIVHVKIESSIVDTWKTTLATLKRKEKCVVVDNWILHWNFLASPAIPSLWKPSFQNYLSRHFRWSPQILDIVERTQSTLNLRTHFTGLTGEPYMAVHLPRGDSFERCRHHTEAQVGFLTWPNLPLVSSSILPPSLDTENATSVLEHCNPSLSRVMDAIDHHARRRPYVRAIHIIHDGADHRSVLTDLWKLEAALTNPERALRAGWRNGPMKFVTHSGMIPQDRGEKELLVGVEAEIARRADVFVGNGYSDLSSHILMLRMGADFVVGAVPEDLTVL